MNVKLPLETRTGKKTFLDALNPHKHTKKEC